MRSCAYRSTLPAVVFLSLAAQAGKAPRPNIVLFLVDDMGWQDTSVPFHAERTPFNEHFRTPNMERLASRGMKFTQAYSASVCSPTRTAIMTGQSPVRHHVTNWTLYADRDQSGQTARLRSPAWRKEGLQKDDVTLARLLRSAGYRTIHCGKAHWGAYDTSGADPRNLGFDVNIAGHPAGGPGHYHGKKNYGNKVAGGHTRPWGVPGLEKYHGTDTHLTDALTIEALKEMESSVKKGTPFYLYMAHYAVHAPIQEHKPYVDNYRGKSYKGTSIAIPEPEARYASMVEGMDASLGAILDRLGDLGVAENTIVVFTSDNGGLSAHARGTTPRGTGRDTHNWPLREGKGSAYEGGTRVPFLVAWGSPSPENPLQKKLPIRPGSSSSAQIICEDLFPTILNWAGVSRPAGYPVDGRDITPLITGAQAPGAERTLLFHYPHVWGPKGQGYQPHSAIRMGDWKAIYFYQPRTWELYNLAEDLGEQHNRAEDMPLKLGELATRMYREFRRLGAQYPTKKETNQPEAPAWPPAAPNVVIDSTDSGWVSLGEDDFTRVNCDDDTWSWENGLIRCTGKPVGVIRTKKIFTNFELVVEWRHLRSAGNSGVFVWAIPASIKKLEAGQGRLPAGIEVQVLDHGYAEQYEKRHKKKADWFTTNGDVFAVGGARMKPFPPLSPNGKRSFPRKNRSKGVGRWNHYYVRAINGEVRLWVNGEEVSGGAGCTPASGYLCLESEGSPIDFRNLRIRELP